MGKKRRIVLAVLLVAMGGGVAWLALRPTEPPEPVYQGKRLSAWLDDYYISGLTHGSPVENDEVDMVVRGFGTNAIPTLLRMLGSTDSTLKELAWLAQDHFHENLGLTHISLAFVQHVQAGMAFWALGAEAKDAVPRLIDMYDRNQDMYPREGIAYALCGIGPPASNAVPSLLRVVTNAGTNTLSIKSSVRALGRIHAEPEKVVPALTKLLKDPEHVVRIGSILSLQAFGADARPAVPALVESLKDQEDSIRRAAAEALKVIDPEAAAKAGVQ
jgi:hypothetical protein